MNETNGLITVPRGLKNVIVTDTRIGDVRGAEGFYHYRQYDATQLARTERFEDVWHLMYRGALPDAAESAAFAKRIGELRVLDGPTVDLLRRVVTPAVEPLATLRVALAAAGILERPLFDLSEQERTDAAMRYTALAPTIVAAAHRLSRGLDVIDADPTAAHAADYLRMSTGSTDTAAVEALQTYLITTIDHGFNASTFAGRVVASSGSDMTSSILGALGAFLGPLHGGAPGRALAALDEIGAPTNTREWVRSKVAGGEVIMGFGHAVYRTHDPRAELLKEVVTQRYDSPPGPPGDSCRGRDRVGDQRAEAWAQAVRERRVLRGGADERGGPAAGDVHADVRCRSHRRLDGQHPGAGGRAQDHSARRPVRGTRAAAGLTSHAGMRVPPTGRCSARQATSLAR